MLSANIYLTFNGDCEAAFNFYKSVFGGKFGYISRFKDMPPSEEYPVSEDDAEKIMHVSLSVGESVIMGSDTSSAFASKLISGNNFSISINATSIEETERLFNSLSQGGMVKMPLAKTFWGAYFGMFTDKFGINWMVNHELNEGK